MTTSRTHCNLIYFGWSGYMCVGSPELQPTAENVGLHGLALLGTEPKLRNQLRGVLQRVTVSQLTWRQEDVVKLQLHV